MKCGRYYLLHVHVEPGLEPLIKKAIRKTKLSRADVMRSALPVGLLELVKRAGVTKRPRRNLVEFMDTFAGLVKPNKELVKASRFG